MPTVTPVMNDPLVLRVRPDKTLKDPDLIRLLFYYLLEDPQDDDLFQKLVRQRPNEYTPEQLRILRDLFLM